MRRRHKIEVESSIAPAMRQISDLEPAPHEQRQTPARFRAILEAVSDGWLTAEDALRLAPMGTCAMKLGTGSKATFKKPLAKLGIRVDRPGPTPDG